MSVPSQPCSIRVWKADLPLIERAAKLLDREARSFADGFIIQGADGSQKWCEEWAHVRHHELSRTAERLREMKQRYFSESNKTGERK
jgi:hypothetical protein